MRAFWEAVGGVAMTKAMDVQVMSKDSSSEALGVRATQEDYVVLSRELESVKVLNQQLECELQDKAKLVDSLRSKLNSLERNGSASSLSPVEVNNMLSDAKEDRKPSSASKCGKPPVLPLIVKKPRPFNRRKERTGSGEPGCSRYWTPSEHQLFLAALRMYGHKDLKSIAAHVRTRNITQVRTHAQKYFIRLMREAQRLKEISGDDEDISESRPEEANLDTSGVSLLSLVADETFRT